MTTRMETSSGYRANLIEYDTTAEGLNVAVVQFDGEEHCSKVLLGDIHELESNAPCSGEGCYETIPADELYCDRCAGGMATRNAAIDGRVQRG